MSSKVRISTFRHSCGRKSSLAMIDLRRWEIPGHVSLVEGNGGLAKFVIQTATSEAEIYLHGAHVTRFQKKGEQPILFVSAASEFTLDKPIRGGVPLIFPWFGPREGLPAHGLARTGEWTLAATSRLPAGAVSLVFKLANIDFYEVEFRVTVSDRLTMELHVANTGASDAVFENCLHSYFHVSAIESISITGLRNVRFIDKVNQATCLEIYPTLAIGCEVDRVYLDTTGTIGIIDPGFGRKIWIEKSGSNSTVVWNPWIEKSKRLSDFGDEEYQQMVCVESGNVAGNQITLPPGGSSLLRVVVSSEQMF
jgi:glucose-6-phosphate 1-epimerase